MVDGQAQRSEDLVGLRALNGDDAIGIVEVLDRDALGRGRLEELDDLGRVGGVGDQEDVVVTADIGDEIVDDATGFVAAHGVLRLAGSDLAEIVGEAGVDEVQGAGAGDARLAQVGDVEDPDPVTDSRVFGDHSATGVFDGHLPAPEVGHLRAEGDVAVVQW